MAAPTTTRATPGGRSPVPPVAARRQRRWSLALVAILLTIGSALLFVILWLNAGDRKPVLALARTVPAGQTIGAGDLTTVRISSDPLLSPIPANRRRAIIGKQAAVDLVKGTLLTDAQLGKGIGLEAGTAVVAVTLPGAQLPVGDLRPGNEVLVVQVPDAAQARTAQQTDITVLTRGRVFSVDKVESSSSTVRVSVVVDAGVGPQIAAANAADRVRLALVPRS
jgi:hypothetical protein